jgi:hypothetical protein
VLFNQVGICFMSSHTLIHYYSNVADVEENFGCILVRYNTLVHESTRTRTASQMLFSNVKHACR